MHTSFLKKCFAQKKSLFTILGGAFFCIALASCNNFLKANDVKKEIEDSIAYANAKTCTLYLKSNSAMGSFLAEGGVTCKVGYSTELQFTLKKDDYYFVSLEALSTTDDSQSRADCVEFTLNEKKSDLERGVYVFTAKLLKAADDILIQPKCLEIPYIKQYSPSETRVQYANTPIVITFNMPVEDEAVSQAESVFNYDNIKLSAANIDYSYYNDSFDGDMRDYFYPPEFNSQKTLLTLIPKSELLKQFVANLQSELKLSFLEINVSFTNITVEQEELTFSLKEGTVSDFVIRYNSETEETAPDKKEFFITKEKITLADAALASAENKYEQVSLEKNFGHADCNKRLLAPSTLYIYGKYYDEESGVESIEVAEKLELVYPYTPGLNETIISSYSIREKTDSISFYEDGTGYTSFVIKYTLQETLKPSPKAGIISLTVLVKDLCGNCSESVKVAVLNMDYYSISNLHSIWDKSQNKYTSSGSGILAETSFDICNAPVSESTSVLGSYDFIKFNSDIKTIRIKDEYKPSLFFLNRDVKRKDITDNTDNVSKYVIFCNEVDYVCEYIDRYGVKRRDPFTPYNSETMERSVVLDVEKVAGMSFDVIPMYKGCPVGRQKFTFPDVPLLTSIGDNIVVMDAESQGDDVTINPLALCKYPDNSYKIVFITQGSVTKSNIPDGCSCYLFYARLQGENQTFPVKKYSFDESSQTYIEDDNYTLDVSTELGAGFSPVKRWFDRGLMSELLGPYSKVQPAEDQPETPETKFNKSPGSDGYINVTLQWDSVLWDNYDVLLCKLDTKLVTLRKTDTFITQTSEGDKVCYTIPVESTKFFEFDSGTVKNNQINYECRGVKNNITSGKESKNVSLTPQDQIDLDNIKPSSLYFNRIVCNDSSIRPSYEFYFYDYGSGPQTGNFWINDNPFKYQMGAKQGVNNIYERAVDIGNFNWGTNTIKYELEDKNHNKTEGTLLINLPESTEIDLQVVSNATANGTTFTAKPLSFYKDYVNDGKGVLNIYGYSSSAKKWISQPIATFDKSHGISGENISVTVTGYTFINVVFTGTNSNGYSYFNSAIYYTNTFDATGKNNYVIPNGTKNDSVVICSNDSNVLVRVYGTGNDRCQDWNEDKWELFGIRYTEEVFPVDSKTPTVYTNNWLKGSWSGFYCVVAHFANGDCVASPVMHR